MFRYGLAHSGANPMKLRTPVGADWRWRLDATDDCAFGDRRNTRNRASHAAAREDEPRAAEAAENTALPIGWNAALPNIPPRSMAIGFLAAPHHLATARATALGCSRRKNHRSELEREHGGSGLRYSFDIKSGVKVYEVGVDAKTGKVLENAVEGRCLTDRCL